MIPSCVKALGTILPGGYTTDQNGLTLLFLPFPLLPRVPELKLQWAPALPSSLALRAALPSSATQQSPLLLPWLPTSSKETRTGSAPVTKTVPTSRWDLLAVLAQPCPISYQQP